MNGTVNYADENIFYRLYSLKAIVFLIGNADIVKESVSTTETIAFNTNFGILIEIAAKIIFHHRPHAYRKIINSDTSKFIMHAIYVGICSQSVAVLLGLS